MTAVADRPLRADAARNAERILRAAREIYAEFGPDAPMDAIARRAGTNKNALYRRWPHRAALGIAAYRAHCADAGQAPHIVLSDRLALVDQRPDATAVVIVTCDVDRPGEVTALRRLSRAAKDAPIVVVSPRSNAGWARSSSSAPPAR